MDSNIPVIDLQEFEDSEESYKKLREACEQWGCFRVVNHGICPNLMSKMKEVVASLFDRPIEIKRRNGDATTGSGYILPSPPNPLYEALGLYDLASPEALCSFCDQLDTTSHQRDTIEKYAKAAHDLVADIGRKMVKSIGLDGDLFEGWPCQVWMNKYHFNPETVGLSGVRIHTDNAFLTLLQADENVGGLEVLNEGSGEFEVVDHLPNTLLVNVGDVAKVWSNGRFCNVKHRVQCKEASTRFSIAALLLAPKEEAIEAPPELVDNEHPRLYTAFVFEDYRNFRLSTMMRAGEALEFLRASTSP